MPKTHQQWVLLFLATPNLLGIVDSYGIELTYLIRDVRLFERRGSGLLRHGETR